MAYGVLRRCERGADEREKKDDIFAAWSAQNWGACGLGL